MVNEAGIIITNDRVDDNGDNVGSDNNYDEGGKEEANDLGGRFLGEEDIQQDVMEDMLVRRVFVQYNSTGFFASCKGLEDTDDANPLSSILNVLFNLKCLFSMLLQVMMSLMVLLQTILSLTQELVMATVEFYTSHGSYPDEYCIKDFTKYHLTTLGHLPQSHTLSCDNCTKSYFSQMHGDTNMLLVMVDEVCRCPLLQQHPLLFQPEENMDEERQRGADLYGIANYTCSPYQSPTAEMFNHASHPNSLHPCILLALILLSICLLYP